MGVVFVGIKEALGVVCPDAFLIVLYSIGLIALFSFFFLDEKETKNQGKPDRLRAFCRTAAPG